MCIRDRAALFALELSDGAARVEKLKDVSNTLEYNGFRSAVSLGEYALIRCYGMNGEDGLARLRLSDGTLEPATFAYGDIYALTPYTLSLIHISCPAAPWRCCGAVYRA